MLMARLCEEMGSCRERLERSPLMRGLVDPELSQRYYAAVLGANFGFYAPLEARLLAAADWGALGFDLKARLKTPMLEADLSCFDLDGELLRALPRCMCLPRLPNLPAAIGSMYVLEGATLGGQLIARELATTLAIGPVSGAAFYNSYCARLMPMWRDFRAFAEEHGRGHEDAVIAAASATFAALEAWYAESHRAIAGARALAPEYAMAH